MLIGDGLIGVEPFRMLIADRRSQDVPLILETPQLNYEIGEDDETPDPYDVQMMALLESLLSSLCREPVVILMPRSGGGSAFLSRPSHRPVETA